MDAREGENSQVHRTSIKRPWDEERTVLPESGNSQTVTLLPPIDAVSYRRSPMPQGPEYGDAFKTWYGPASRESDFKRIKFEGHNHTTSSGLGVDVNGRVNSTWPHNFMYSTHRGAPQSPTSSPNKRVTTGGPAESQGHSLCWKCRRTITQDGEETSPYSDAESCGLCKGNPELAWVTQAAATGLTQLADTLRSGISSEKRGIIRVSGTGFMQQKPYQHDLEPVGCPPIAEYGLKQTLNWILGRIHQVNFLADEFVSHASVGTLQNLNKEIPQHGAEAQGSPMNIMKRRLEDDADHAGSSREGVIDLTSDVKLHTRRKSLTIAPTTYENLLPTRLQTDYHSSLYSTESQSSRTSIMNPPPAPNRQLPSPPGRSLPSPTSLNFPSPSASSHGNNTQGVNLHLPSNLTRSGAHNYLPPINTTHLSETAIREHSAALQHEVSLQKIALSSLQGEHDKLLAAFSRSQTRASALEKKHAVSDSEIIGLTEEKLRLQTQVIDLERDVEELSRSRDESRQAAVQEGAQYVEIVKKASRLEEIRVDERKSWNELKKDMERKIQELSKDRVKNDIGGGLPPDEDVTRHMRIIDDIDTDTPASPVDMKVEPPSEPRSAEVTSNSKEFRQPSVEELKSEIQRLRERCTKVESALRAIRSDSRAMEGIFKAIQDQADSTLAE